MTRLNLLIALAVALIVLAIAGLIACTFGVIKDLDNLALAQTACFICLIVPLYALSQIDGSHTAIDSDMKARRAARHDA